jgi:Surface antigen
MNLKKFLLIGSVVVTSVLGVGFFTPPTLTSAAVVGDDYPTRWKNAALDSVADSWGMYNRECTSFVANRLSSVNKFNLNRGGLNWNANMWGTNARAQGYAVNKTPGIGSVAWWSGKFHVGWVAEISGNQVRLEEYNNPAGTGRYNTRWINKDAVDGYIHFKDLNNVPKPAPKPVPTQKLKVYPINELKKVNGIWQVKSNTLVPVAFNWTQNGIAVSDVDLTDSSGKLLPNQNAISNGKYFTFIKNRVNGATSPIKADGGYYWSKVSLTGSGQIWLSVSNVNDLLYGKK